MEHQHLPDSPLKTVLPSVPCCSSFICDIYYPQRRKAQVSQFAGNLYKCPSSKHAKYAAKKLQTWVTEIKEWANVERKINPTKTQCVIFTQHPHKNEPINLKVYGRSLDLAFRKGLGVTFHQKMNNTTAKTPDYAKHCHKNVLRNIQIN